MNLNNPHTSVSRQVIFRFPYLRKLHYPVNCFLSCCEVIVLRIYAELDEYARTDFAKSIRCQVGPKDSHTASLWRGCITSSWDWYCPLANCDWAVARRSRASSHVYGLGSFFIIHPMRLANCITIATSELGILKITSSIIVLFSILLAKLLHFFGICKTLNKEVLFFSLFQHVNDRVAGV